MFPSHFEGSSSQLDRGILEFRIIEFDIWYLSLVSDLSTSIILFKLSKPIRICLCLRWSYKGTISHCFKGTLSMLSRWHFHSFEQYIHSTFEYNSLGLWNELLLSMFYFKAIAYCICLVVFCNYNVDINIVTDTHIKLIKGWTKDLKKKRNFAGQILTTSLNHFLSNKITHWNFAQPVRS